MRSVRASAAILWAVCVLACLTTAFVFHAEAQNSTSATAASPVTVRRVAFQPRVRRAELGLDHTADYRIVGPASKAWPHSRTLRPHRFEQVLHLPAARIDQRRLLAGMHFPR